MKQIEPKPIERWDGLYIILPPFMFNDPQFLKLWCDQYPNTKIARQEDCPRS
jgi:hypothetical protein